MLEYAEKIRFFIRVQYHLIHNGMPPHMLNVNKSLFLFITVIYGQNIQNVLYK